ncbi:MAG: hypothetical protein AAF809_11070 [Bacteroidota bacterium]
MTFRAFPLLLALVVALAGCDSTSDEPDVERSYSKSIVREAASGFEATLLAQAEATYPSRDSVVAAAQDPSFVPETEYWYYSRFDGVNIPYAITGDAVTYYADLIDALEAGEELQSLTIAELDYQARVSFREAYTFEGPDPLTLEPLPPESFERVYVVEMSLAWSQYCGPLCAMWIDHERVVVFDEAGTLLRVYLDGARPVAVS